MRLKTRSKSWMTWADERGGQDQYLDSGEEGAEEVGVEDVTGQTQVLKRRPLVSAGRLQRVQLHDRVHDQSFAGAKGAVVEGEGPEAAVPSQEQTSQDAAILCAQ